MKRPVRNVPSNTNKYFTHWIDTKHRSTFIYWFFKNILIRYSQLSLVYFNLYNSKMKYLWVLFFFFLIHLFIVIVPSKLVKIWNIQNNPNILPRHWKKQFSFIDFDKWWQFEICVDANLTSRTLIFLKRAQFQGSIYQGKHGLNFRLQLRSS